MICKEKCIQTAEKERFAEDVGLKVKANPVFFISLVGLSWKGLSSIVDKDEYIFDIYTKSYDFQGSSVKILSAQDLWAFYQSKNQRANREKVDIYCLVEYFIQHHLDGNFVLDECPFLKFGK